MSLTWIFYVKVPLMNWFQYNSMVSFYEFIDWLADWLEPRTLIMLSTETWHCFVWQDTQPAGVFPFEFVDHFKSAYRVNELPLTFLHPIRDTDDPTSLARILYELKPRFVVLYDAEMAFVRQLEVWNHKTLRNIRMLWFLL